MFTTLRRITLIFATSSGGIAASTLTTHPGINVNLSEPRPHD
jgi:hypothetical protein